MSEKSDIRDFERHHGVARLRRRDEIIEIPQPVLLLAALARGDQGEIRSGEFGQANRGLIDVESVRLVLTAGRCLEFVAAKQRHNEV